LIILGYRTYRSHPSTETEANGSNGNLKAFLSAFFLTLTNPMSIFAFAAVFASIGIKEVANNHVFALFLVAGIFLGTMIWFSLLTSLVHLFKGKIDTEGICLVNKIAGTVLGLFGILALLSGIFGL
jgi:threonine/homoserine/homoserine lactone efflux protein